MLPGLMHVLPPLQPTVTIVEDETVAIILLVLARPEAMLLGGHGSAPVLGVYARGLPYMRSSCPS